MKKPLTVHVMAARISRAIFEVGDENGRPATRIQFKLGDYPDNEIDACGLCEDALTNVVVTTLQQMCDEVDELMTTIP
jgi:hypothetical protein